MKYLFAAITIAGIAAIAVICVYGNAESDRCRAFLSQYGWETEAQSTDHTEVYIPQAFDEVYKSYNELQKQAELDLSPYRGMSGIRYTFIVTNYPLDVGEPVYANVICINGSPVAGDIMTVSARGFMHSLAESGD
ncbi:MAG: DUF4830 domain-containing protein [Clostridia bacterium]|nr:DUF4830 domain-containing protein [Clostridia bacterium]